MDSINIHGVIKVKIGKWEPNVDRYGKRYGIKHITINNKDGNDTEIILFE